MRFTDRRVLRGWVLFSTLCFIHVAGSTLSAQIPDRFTNLQVFPRDIGRRELIDAMRRFCSALGVRCENCHAGDGGPKLENMDFASDDKQPKRTARIMMKMVQAIEAEHLSKLGAEHLPVDCFTCHRGVSRPESIEATMSGLLVQSGIETAVTRYRELRKEYYGTASYDFGERPLNALGERLLTGKKPQEALAMLALNAEFHPDAAWLQHLLGEAYLANGDKDRARQAFEKSLGLNPDNPLTKRRLEELKSEKP